MAKFIEEPLTLAHKEIFTRLWSALCLKYDLRFSEYSFANDYLFRETHEHRFIPEYGLIRGRFSDGSHYLIPTMHPNELLKHIGPLLRETGDHLYPIPDQWIPSVESLGMKVSQNRDDSDYLSHTEKLKTLSGRNLSSRRNLLHQLQADHRLESKPLELSDVPSALDLLEEWQSHAAMPKEKTDYFACKESLENMSALGLCGRLAFADGELLGFTVGELLTPSLALLHMLKTRREVKGATPYLYQEFASHLPASVEWVNFEQDLGIPALRQAKQAYQPDQVLTKWRAHF